MLRMRLSHKKQKEWPGRLLGRWATDDSGEKDDGWQTDKIKKEWWNCVDFTENGLSAVTVCKGAVDYEIQASSNNEKIIEQELLLFWFLFAHGSTGSWAHMELKKVRDAKLNPN